MSDLLEIRATLHRLTEQLAGAAAIVELDADAMRAAILDALESFAEAETLAQGRKGYAAAMQYERAAKVMAARLRLLHSAAINAALAPEVEP